MEDGDVRMSSPEDSGTAITAERLAELRSRITYEYACVDTMHRELLAEVERLRAALTEATKPGKWYPPQDNMTLTVSGFTSIMPPEYSRTSAPRMDTR